MASALEQFLHYTDTTPPVQAYRIDQTGPELDDETMEDDVFNPSLDRICGSVLGICYTDSRGRQSTRQISITHADNEHLGGYCYLRKRYRSFRIDRIQTVFNDDGEAMEFAEFLELFTQPIEDAPLWLQVAYNHHAEIILLTALARADGHFHPEELDVIVCFINNLVENNGTFLSDDDIKSLSGHIARQYPRPEIVMTALDAIVTKDPVFKDRLHRAAVTVMNADGEQDDEEFRFLVELKEALDI